MTASTVVLQGDQMSDSRLDKIEDKLDQIANALVDLVRIEGKLDNTNQRLEAQSERLDKQEVRMNGHSDRILHVRDTLIKSEGSNRVFERIFWLIFTASIGAITYLLRT